MALKLPKLPKIKKPKLPKLKAPKLPKLKGPKMPTIKQPGISGLGIGSRMSNINIWKIIGVIYGICVVVAIYTFIRYGFFIDGLIGGPTFANLAVIIIGVFGIMMNFIDIDYLKDQKGSYDSGTIWMGAFMIALTVGLTIYALYSGISYANKKEEEKKKAEEKKE
jgi:hypothetical protein